MEALRPYLPSTLLASAARQREPVWWEWLDGSLMHCDVSGFTAMSESMAARGREGAELMVEVLNGFLGRMLEIAEGFGGVQMKFGGDAMLLYFEGDGHAQRAAASGLAMQAAMKPFGKLPVAGDSYSLRMRAGIHSGRFYSASAGDPRRLLHYVLTGHDVSRVAAVEAAATLGAVFVTAETALLLGAGARVRREADGLLSVRKTATLPHFEHGEPPPAEAAPAYLAPVLRTAADKADGEHRRVTSVFINVLGLDALLEKGDEAAVLTAASGYVSTLVALLERHNGHLLGSDVADHGDKFIATFGAPAAAERAETSAMRFALDLREEIAASGLPVQQKIGINAGHVFAGEVGTSNRRDYTVIGDAVNLAARLMAAAPAGQIYVSRATAERAAGQFVLHDLRSIRVKGKAATIGLQRLDSVGETATKESAEPLIGRESEFALLKRLARAVGGGKSRFAYVWGEAGIGKSRLTWEIATRLSHKGWLTVTTGAQPFTSGTPFSAWPAAVESVAKGTPSMARDANAVLGLLRGDGTSDADPRARREAAITGVQWLFEMACLDHNVLLVFEDLHWADESSVAVIERLTSAGVPRLLVLGTSRQPPGEREPDAAIHLDQLTLEDAERLVATTGTDLARLGSIIERANGNPLFLMEMARANLPDGEIPDTVNDLMMARIDSLAPEERRVLRAAAVIGTEFSEPLVGALVSPLSPERTAAILPMLERRGFTRKQSGEPPVYAFAHALLSDVAYESAPFAVRRRLHKRAAEFIEGEHREHEEVVAEVLYHHFSRAGDAEGLIRYGAISGDRAAAVFANRQALEYYTGALEAARAAGADPDIGLLIEKTGDIHEASGRHSDAGQAFADALASWEHAGMRRRRARFVPWRLRPGEHEAVLCRKIAVSAERGSAYDESLRWLERARSSAPPRSARLRAQVSAATCVALFRKGEYREAVEWGRRAVREARGARDLRLVAYAQNMIATGLIEAGRLREAIKYLRPAVRVYHELGDVAGQASANNNLGSTYQLLGVYDAALYHYDVALRADERAGDETDAAIVHNNTAEVLLLLDREGEAIERLEEVLRLIEGEPDLAALGGWANVILGRCHRAMGDLAAAERHLRRGMSILKAVSAYGLHSEALVDRAEQALAEGDPERARRQATAALRKTRELGALLPEARAQRTLGECLDRLGRGRQAEEELRASVQKARRSGSDYEEACSRLALGRHYLESGRPGAAATHLRSARRTFAKAGAHRKASACAGLLEDE